MTEYPGINIIHKKSGIVETTVGRVGSLPKNLLLATPQAAFQGPDKKWNEKFGDKLKPLNTHGNIEIYMGHSPFLRQMKRLFKGPRRTNFFFRMGLGIPTTVAGSLMGKLTRADYYNPWTESAQVFHPSKAMAARGVGYALHFDKANHPTIKAAFSGLPFVHAKIAWKASQEGLKQLDTADVHDASKILEPAMGLSLGVDAGVFDGLTSLALLPVSGIVAGAATLAGHAHSRLFKGNIFGVAAKKG